MLGFKITGNKTNLIDRLRTALDIVMTNYLNKTKEAEVVHESCVNLENNLIVMRDIQEQCCHSKTHTKNMNGTGSSTNEAICKNSK